MRDAVKKEVQTMLDLTIKDPSNSTCCSPMAIVKEKDASNRWYLDFRQINLITLFDNEPMPQPKAIDAKLKADLYFSMFSKGFWQFPISLKDKEQTAFVTSDGCFQFRKMPFWMINGTATFNKMISKLLDNMQNTGSFVDDLLTHAQTWDKYVQLLR